MLWLAYDGSLNSDWVAHYAVRFAQRMEKPSLRLVHVADGTLDRAQLEGRLSPLRSECARAGVALSVDWLDTGATVAQTLLDHVPSGAENFVVCGTRVRARNLAFLRGTVSERLLAAQRFNTLAIRVAQPGLLGSVHNVLAPVLGHPQGYRAGVPLLRLFGEDIERIHVLAVRQVDGLLRLGNQGEAIEAAAEAYVERIRAELAQGLAHSPHIDGSVVLSGDAVSEIVIAAKQHKSQLILLGASERTLMVRALRGTPVEAILQRAPCDVAIYRGVS